MVCCFANGAVYVSRRSSMKRDVIDSGKSAVMRVAGEGRRLCGHEVDVAASPVWPWIRRFEFTAWASNWRFRALHLTGVGLWESRQGWWARGRSMLGGCPVVPGGRGGMGRGLGRLISCR